MGQKRIAVIGGGIAGLAAAWLLAVRHKVTLFEKNDYLGGHARTIELDTADGRKAIDTGFVVYNVRNYPHLVNLLAALNVSSQPTEMSFSASIDGGAIEYAGNGIATLFAQRRNLARPKFLRMLTDIVRFNRAAKRELCGPQTRNLGEFLGHCRFGGAFRDHYLLPMTAAIWSCPCDAMLAFPASHLFRFLDNHGLLDLSGRPQWMTVAGGSYQYIKRMLPRLEHVQVAQPVRAIVRKPDYVEVHVAAGAPQRFDDIVLACHADESLGLLDQPTHKEQALLSSFRYQANRAVLHSDAALMPRRRKVWSAWNYISDLRATDLGGTDQRGDSGGNVSVTYWMNCLQRLGGHEQFFVTLNPLREPARIHSEITFRHPLFDSAAVNAQRDLRFHQGNPRTWFCGSYFGYGFHEDALRAAVCVATALHAPPPWQSPSRPVALNRC
ncbi:MAG: NAD(P)/FAD-dependent oxidoreductase [Gammaproteobacteria bacterium]